MARITVSDLQDIYDTVLTSGQLTAFINTANTFINNSELVEVGLSESLLTEIEKYLAAHFASLRDQRVQQENTAGEYSATYQGKTDMGFNSTQYGQMAVALDTSGTLAAASLKRGRMKVFSTPNHSSDVQSRL